MRVSNSVERQMECEVVSRGVGSDVESDSTSRDVAGLSKIEIKFLYVFYCKLL